MQGFYETTLMRNGLLSWYPFDNDSAVFEQSGGELKEWLKTQVRKVVSDKTNISYNEKFVYPI